MIEHFPEDWLLSIELYELAYKGNETTLCNKILDHLEQVKRNTPEHGGLIDNGLDIIKKELVS